MKSASTVLALLALAPGTAWGIVCNADNVLRALRANSAKASPFCSTYTNPPPNQPLPTYVSQYPASRVSSACTCLITPATVTTLTPTSTTFSSSTTSTSSTPTCTSASTPYPTPTNYVCSGELVSNPSFDTTACNNQAPPWIFAPAVKTTDGASSSAGAFPGYAVLSVNNGPNFSAFGPFQSTSISQRLPSLCAGVTYTLAYTSQVSIFGGQPRQGCQITYTLDGQQLAFSGPPNGDPPPFDKQTRTATFTSSGAGGGSLLVVGFSCSTPGGSYTIYDVSIMGDAPMGGGGK